MTPLGRALLAPAFATLALSQTACSDGAATGGANPSASPSGAAAAEVAPLEVGDAAPDVTLTLANGKKVELKSLQGKQVLVYFYPKDDTTGCTIEAKGLRDVHGDLQAAGVEVYGVSMQGAESHDAFASKYSLPFSLVVDTSGDIARAFHVPIKGEYASRQSFLVGKDGKIAKVWLDVKPADHAAEVLAAAKS